MERTAFKKGFETLNKETSIKELPVQGQFPEWLQGSLIRTGPAKFELGKKNLNHWFDGQAMLHKFSFEKGRVAYMNRFLKGNTYKESRVKGALTSSQFATDPCYSVFGRFMSFFSDKRTDNCNVNVAPLAGKIVAMTETPNLVSFNPETLRTEEHISFNNDLRGHMTTAHPHYDFKERKLYNYMLRFGYNSKYQFFSVPQGKSHGEQIGVVNAKKPSYVHSFGFTENYIVLALFPLNVVSLKLKFKMKPIIENYRWEPERGTRFVVLRKKDGTVVKDITTDAFFAFHHVNAYEQDGDIIADIAVFENAEIVNKLYLNKLRNESQIGAAAQLRRFEIPVENSGEVNHYLLSGADIELPRINYKKHNGKPYQYVYGCSNVVSGNFLDSLVKIDVSTGEYKKWYKLDHYPGEPVFVPAPNAEKEDDGVLLSVVLNAEKERSYLMVLNAADLSEVATAHLLHHIPFGFHGQHFDKEKK